MTSATSRAERSSVPTFVCEGRAESWFERHHDDVAGSYAEVGAVRLRGLGEAVGRFDDFVTAITGDELQSYQGGATPRRDLGGNVYSSTEFDPEYSIDLHSEMAYSNSWPLHLGFCCLESAGTGGATPIAPTDLVAERIPDPLRSALAETGVRYRRAFHDMLGEDWRTVYGVEDVDGLREEVARRGELLESDCTHAVVTSIVLPAFLEQNGYGRWFNQAVAFNSRTLPADVREDLVSVLGEGSVPKDSSLGDGTPFADADIDAMRTAVDSVTVATPWERGDLLVVDNRRFAHGREPYVGARDIRVCMTGVGSWPAPDTAGTESETGAITR